MRGIVAFIATVCVVSAQAGLGHRDDALLCEVLLPCDKTLTALPLLRSSSCPLASSRLFVAVASDPLTREE